MIRLGKPVRLLEWGEGTNTFNQTWTTIGEGVLHNKLKQYAGLTTLVIEVDGKVIKKNEQSKAIKVLQPGEGVTPMPGYWGEVAMGNLKSIVNEGSKTTVQIELDNAVKMVR